MTEITTHEHTLFDFELTEAMYEKYWKFSFGKGVNYKLTRRILIIAWFIIGPSLLMFNLIYYGIIYGNYLDILDALDWLTALIPLGIAVFYLTNYFFGSHRTFRKTPQIHAHFTFDFDQDGVNITSVSGFSSGQSSLQYPLIKKIYETQDAFYVFINNRAGYVVDKSGLIQGNLIAFRIHLKQVLNKKYILCK
jgi:hypothetical protein